MSIYLLIIQLEIKLKEKKIKCSQFFFLMSFINAREDVEERNFANRLLGEFWEFKVIMLV